MDVEGRKIDSVKVVVVVPVDYTADSHTMKNSNLFGVVGKEIQVEEEQGGREAAKFYTLVDNYNSHGKGYIMDRNIGPHEGVVFVLVTD